MPASIAVFAGPPGRPGHAERPVVPPPQAQTFQRVGPYSDLPTPTKEDVFSAMQGMAPKDGDSFMKLIQAKWALDKAQEALDTAKRENKTDIGLEDDWKKASVAYQEQLKSPNLSQVLKAGDASIAATRKVLAGSDRPTADQKRIAAGLLKAEQLAAQVRKDRERLEAPAARPHGTHDKEPGTGGGKFSYSGK